MEFQQVGIFFGLFISSKDFAPFVALGCMEQAILACQVCRHLRREENAFLFEAGWCQDVPRCAKCH